MSRNNERNLDLVEQKTDSNVKVDVQPIGTSERNSDVLVNRNTKIDCIVDFDEDEYVDIECPDSLGKYSDNLEQSKPGTA